MEFKEKRYEEDGYTNILIEAVVDGEVVGNASIIVSNDEAYIERLDVNEEHQSKGYGTQIIKHIAGLYDYTYAAPDNAECKRLFERIGCEMSSQKYDEVGAYVDQGFGVYEL
jgi:GNAT superfamily N-acetyltransferase